MKLYLSAVLRKRSILVAKTWGDQNLSAGDEIIVSHLEHHANIVPWKQLADKKGLKLRVIPVDDDGQIILDEYAKLLNPKTKLVSFTQVSNALGNGNTCKANHRNGACRRSESFAGWCAIGFAFALGCSRSELRLVCIFRT